MDNATNSLVLILGMVWLALPATAGASGDQCASPHVAIPDGVPGGVTSDIVVSGSGSTVFDLEVALLIDHTWVGDLEVVLSKDGIPMPILDRPGVPLSPFGCSGDDIDATFSPAGTSPVEFVCDPTPPAIEGILLADTDMHFFDGQPLDGTWRLTVIDHVASDSGTLEEWCLTFTHGDFTGGTGSTAGTPTPATTPWGLAFLVVTLLGCSLWLLRGDRQT